MKSRLVAERRLMLRGDGDGVGAGGGGGVAGERGGGGQKEEKYRPIPTGPRISERRRLPDPK